MNKKEFWEKLRQRNYLKKQLQKEDYKIIKCYEASLTNEPLPYDIHELKAKRDSIREQIRELKNYVNSNQTE